ncbi:MAG: YbaK/EbsC family protein [Thermoleophilia bacterium]|nr:YbaK/EbsC family protein [Thermoleophilia bacterium]
MAALTKALEGHGIAYELLEHSRTERAVDEAKALGLPPHEVAKTIVVTTGARNVRVVLPASERIDMRKLREALGAGKELHLLTEEDLARAYPEFELGAVPPVGGPDDDVVVDRRVADKRQVVFEAGSHEASVRVSAADLVALPRARVADVCLD